MCRDLLRHRPKWQPRLRTVTKLQIEGLKSRNHCLVFRRLFEQLFDVFSVVLWFSSNLFEFIRVVVIFVVVILVGPTYVWKSTRWKAPRMKLLYYTILYYTILYQLNDIMEMGMQMEGDWRPASVLLACCCLSSSSPLLVALLLYTSIHLHIYFLRCLYYFFRSLANIIYPTTSAQLADPRRAPLKRNYISKHELYKLLNIQLTGCKRVSVGGRNTTNITIKHIIQHINNNKQTKQDSRAPSRTRSRRRTGSYRWGTIRTRGGLVLVLLVVSEIVLVLVLVLVFIILVLLLLLLSLLLWSLLW